MPFQTVSTDRDASVLDPGHASSPLWRLHVVASPDPLRAGTVVPLAAGLTQVGRGVDDKAGHLLLRDPRVSRQHAVLQVVGHSVQIHDLDSRHGVLHAGLPIRQAVLGHGAVLRLGDTVAVLECDSGEFPDHDRPDPDLPGRSAMARTLRGQLAQAAVTGHPLLITGDTGTGKEHAAALVHRLSRRPGALVRVNIAAVPEHLFESLLFGHVRGAFSGATEASPGLARQADRGTLVLDEIGELPLSAQPKLLRLLDGTPIRPLGGTSDLRCDIRFVASTNADLARMVAAGRFRQDLLARLRVRSVWLPPVVARRPDLLDLADALGPAGDGQPWRDRLPADAVEWLLLQPLADNLRGLAALLFDLEALARQGPLTRARLDKLRRHPQGQPLAPSVEPGRQPLDPPDRSALGPALEGPGAEGVSVPTSARRQPNPARPDAEVLDGLLRQCHGNVEQLRQALGRDRKQVYRLLKYAGIAVSDLAKYRRGDKADR